jgi:hypothetical protein
VTSDAIRVVSRNLRAYPDPTRSQIHALAALIATAGFADAEAFRLVSRHYETLRS